MLKVMLYCFMFIIGAYSSYHDNFTEIKLGEKVTVKLDQCQQSLPRDEVCDLLVVTPSEKEKIDEVLNVK